MADTGWYLIPEDDDDLMDDVIVFEYRDRFDYRDFVEKVTPLIQEELDHTVFDHLVEDDLNYDMCDADYTPEIEAMFVRMGLPKLDGAEDLSFTMPFSYVEIIIQRETKYGVVYDRLPLDVDCMLEVRRLPEIISE